VLLTGQTLLVPGCYDVLSAKISGRGEVGEVQV
jgi:hypothetical protein